MQAQGKWENHTAKDKMMVVVFYIMFLLQPGPLSAQVSRTSLSLLFPVSPGFMYLFLSFLWAAISTHTDSW